MTAAAASLVSVDSATAVRRINDTLQGPVIDILSQYLPEMKALPRDDAFDHVLDDLDLLDRCFKTFRLERRHFRFVLVNARHRPVEDEEAALYCGRTLGEVVAMIVRTAAKRYFRRSLSPKGPRKTLPRPVSAKAAPRPERNLADELYTAIQEHLLHEWQVPLVPTYAHMSPGLARRLGPRILEAREPELLRRLMSNPDMPLLPPAPEPEAQTIPATVQFRLEDLLTPNGERLRAEMFTATLLRPEVRAALSNAEQVVRITDVLRGVGGAAARALIDGLDLSQEQLAVILVSSRECLGQEMFGRIFGLPGNPALVARVAANAQTAGLGRHSDLMACAAFTRGVFSRFAAAEKARKQA